MEEKEIDKLIVVESLPVIVEQLELIGQFIDEKLLETVDLECNETNKSIVKDKRTELNNIKKYSRG